jgi:hypothetical protein
MLESSRVSTAQPLIMRIQTATKFDVRTGPQIQLWEAFNMLVRQRVTTLEPRQAALLFGADAGECLSQQHQPGAGVASPVPLVGRLLKTTFNHWLEDKAPQLGAALAYYTVFSLAPMVLVLFAVFNCYAALRDDLQVSTRCEALMARRAARRGINHKSIGTKAIWTVAKKFYADPEQQEKFAATAIEFLNAQQNRLTLLSAQ